MQRYLRATFSQVVWAALGSSIGNGILPTLLGDSDPSALSKLITGIGNVDSTDIANRIFQLSRRVNASAEVQAAFDAGPDGAFERIRVSDSADATAFTAAVEAFMYEHGSRGPNEYDPYSWSYESRPMMLSQAIDKARGASDDADPAKTLATGAAERQRLIEQYTSGLRRQRRGARDVPRGCQLARRVHVGPRALQEQPHPRGRRGARVLPRARPPRAVAKGHLAHERQVFMLLADEVDVWVADPSSFTAKLAERETDYLSLHELEPPYIVFGSAPPLSEWKRKDAITAEPVTVGDLLRGVAGSPGTVTGTARVMLSLDDAEKLDPGDILIAESTDPSWTPLFLAAGGVITNIGAVGTHAVIVSRELGIPCVPSIANATRRIPDGATITLDGGKGTVTIDALP